MPPMPADTVPVHCHKLHAHPETTKPSIRARSFSIAGGGGGREKGGFGLAGGGVGGGAEDFGCFTIRFNSSPS